MDPSGRGAQIGHPGKSGTRNQLLSLVFQNIPSECKTQMLNNIRESIFSPDALGGSLTRNYRVADMSYIQTLYEFLKTET